MTRDFSNTTISELSRRIAAREVSPVEVAIDFLERIEKIDPALNSYVFVDEDGTLEQARRAEAEIRQGGLIGPLHGVPLSVKDIIETAGIRTSGQSKLRLEYVPECDAAVVRALKAAGAVLLGKNTTHEFATFGPSFDLPFPPARNPWNLDYTSGGSSSGSGVAVAAGLSMGALGTDTAGSIRIPSAHCGVVGMKPTYGRVDLTGIFPLAFSLDTCGPITRTVEDNALMLEAIAEHRPGEGETRGTTSDRFRSQLARGIEGSRIGVIAEFYNRRSTATPAQTLAMREAVAELEGLGAVVEKVQLPPLEDYHACELAIVLSEAYAVHRQDLQERRSEFSELFRRSITLGAFVTASEYVQANRLRKKLAVETNKALEMFDVLLTATTHGPASRIDRPPRHDFVRFPYLTGPANVTGHPSINVCCGFSQEGLPLGMQFLGRYFDEGTLYRFAHAYEQATSWHTMSPPISLSPKFTD